MSRIIRTNTIKSRRNTCAIDGCKEPTYGYKLCRTHFDRIQTYLRSERRK